MSFHKESSLVVYKKKLAFCRRDHSATSWRVDYYDVRALHKALFIDRLLYNHDDELNLVFTCPHSHKLVVASRELSAK